jgi:hypothetical protein
MSLPAGIDAITGKTAPPELFGVLRGRPETPMGGFF